MNPSSGPRASAPSAERCTVSVGSQEPQWGDFLPSCPRSSIFHDPKWGELLGGPRGNRAWYLTARREGKICGILTLVEQNSLIFGRRMTSLPYMDASGILAIDQPAADDLLASAKALLAQRRLKWLELRHRHNHFASLPARNDKVTLRLPLDEPDAMWKQIGPKVRNRIRKAQKARLQVLTGDCELLGGFHSVYARTMRDLGSPPHGRGFFRSLLETFGEAVNVHVVRDGIPLAVAITMRDGQAVCVPWAASDHRANESCANMLLYWHLLEHAAGAGAKVFDFGRSTAGSGTYIFKKQWGAQEHALHWHYLLNDGDSPPGPAGEGGAHRAIRACWRRLPVGISIMIGSRIIRRLA